MTDFALPAWLRASPFVVCVGLVPFVVRAYVYTVPSSLFERVNMPPDSYVDLFGYWKELIFAGAALCGVALAFLQISLHRFGRAPLAVWGATAIWVAGLTLALVRSAYSELDLLGFFTIFSGSLWWCG